MSSTGEQARPGWRALWGEKLLLAALLALIVLAIDPRGDFPLNDDWNFALGTWWFADHGEFRFARFTGMSLRAQIVWGALWTWAFGKSFEVLRVSTIALAFVSAFLFHALLARTSISRSVRLLASIAFIASPYFIWSTHTYMTQIPFLTANLAAVLAWVIGAEKRSSWWFVAGALGAIVACFIRQSGVATLAAGAAVLLVVWARSDRRFRIAASLSLVVAGALLLYLLMATQLLHGRPEEFALRLGLFDQGIVAAVRKIASQTIVNFAFIMQYATLALLGVMVALASGRLDRKTLAIALVVALPITWGASTMATMRGPLPYDIHGNILMGAGLGPPTLRDVWVFRYPVPRPMPLALRWVLTVGTVLAASLAIARFARAIPMMLRGWPERDRIAWMAGAGMFAGGSAILFTTDIFFDRYALDAAWSLALLAPLTTRWTRARLIAASLLTAGVLVFSTVATSDYLAWNRARWEAFDRLRARGVTLAQMDGGYEINQYLIGGFDGPAFLKKGQFSVIDDEWILSFREVDGYRTVDRVDYDRWSGSGAIFIQQRTSGFRMEFDLDV